MKTRIVRCPRCKRSARYDDTNPNRPFCSERCKTIDVAAWASEAYRVAAEPATEESISTDDERGPEEE